MRSLTVELSDEEYDVFERMAKLLNVTPKVLLKTTVQFTGPMAATLGFRLPPKEGRPANPDQPEGDR